MVSIYIPRIQLQGSDNDNSSDEEVENVDEMEHLEPVVDDDQDYQDWDQDSDFEEVEEDDALDGSFGQDDLNNADETVILGKVTKLLNKIRSFSKFCRKSTRIADAVSKLTGEDGLNYKRFLVDFHVRWNTTYLMLQRFLEMKNIVVYLH